MPSAKTSSALATTRVENIGDTSQALGSGNQKASDVNHNTYDADEEVSIDANQGDTTFLNQINPGNAVTGIIAFDISEGVTLTELEPHDSPFSQGARVRCP